MPTEYRPGNCSDSHDTSTDSNADHVPGEGPNPSALVLAETRIMHAQNTVRCHFCMMILDIFGCGR